MGPTATASIADSKSTTGGSKRSRPRCAASWTRRSTKKPTRTRARLLYNAARRASTGVTGGIRFQIVSLRVDDDRTPDDSVRSVAAHRNAFEYHVERGVAVGIEREITHVSRVT